MKAAPPTGSSNKSLRAARAIESFDRAPTTRADQEFLTKIKRAKITQRDVKNEGTSGDMYENKGQNDTMSYNHDDLLTENSKFLAKSYDNRSASGEKLHQGAETKANYRGP